MNRKCFRKSLDNARFIARASLITTQGMPEPSMK